MNAKRLEWEIIAGLYPLMHSANVGDGLLRINVMPHPYETEWIGTCIAVGLDLHLKATSAEEAKAEFLALVKARVGMYHAALEGVG